MANCTNVVLAVAKRLRPTVFRWTAKNYKKDVAPYSLMSYEREQERILGIVKEILLIVERLGYRIIKPGETVTPEVIQRLIDMRELGYSDEEVISAQLLMIKPLFPKEEVHGEHRKKYFKSLKE